MPPIYGKWRSSAALMNTGRRRDLFQENLSHAGLEEFAARGAKARGGAGRGRPIIQIQTPFGGGKTHALIAMYHRTQAWNAKRVVIVARPWGHSTLWGLIEEQLTGSIAGRCAGQVSPGKETI